MTSFMGLRDAYLADNVQYIPLVRVMVADPLSSLSRLIAR